VPLHATRRDANVTITESTRHQFHQALIASVGEEEASTLMEHLPPVGWADVATKTDIDNLRVATSADFTAVNLKLDTTAAEIRCEPTTQLGSFERRIVTAMFCLLTVLGIVLGALITLN